MDPELAKTFIIGFISGAIIILILIYLVFKKKLYQYMMTEEEWENWKKNKVNILK